MTVSRSCVLHGMKWKSFIFQISSWFIEIGSEKAKVKPNEQLLLINNYKFTHTYISKLNLIHNPRLDYRMEEVI